MYYTRKYSQDYTHQHAHNYTHKCSHTHHNTRTQQVISDTAEAKGFVPACQQFEKYIAEKFPRN